MKIEATLTGVDELRAKLETLAYRGASRASGKAIRAGLKVLERVQKQAVPVDSGLLRRSINSRFLRKNKQRKGMTTAMSGMNVGRKKPSNKLPQDESVKRLARFAPHGHLVSLGTRERWAGIKYGRRDRATGQFNESMDSLTGKPIRYRGVMPENPIFRQASKAAEPAAIAAVAQVLAREIEAEAAKAK